MNDNILLELADRWDRDAVNPAVEAEDPIHNQLTKGQRECKRECADTLRTLVSMLGVKPIE